MSSTKQFSPMTNVWPSDLVRNFDGHYLGLIQRMVKFRMIRLRTEPTPKELKKLDDYLEEYNTLITGIDDAEAIGMTVYDKQKLMGSLNGVTSFDWLHIATR